MKSAVLAGCFTLGLIVGLIIPKDLNHTHNDSDEFKKFEVQVQDREREYFVATPEIIPETKYPVVIGFHGGTGGGLSFETRTGLWKYLKAKPAYFVLAEGLSNYWNDGSDSVRVNKSVDDVEFVNVLIKELLKKYPIDENAIFLAGYSRGANFVHRFACDGEVPVAGILAVGGTPADDVANNCKFKSSPSLMLVQGNQDPVVPFNGGRVRNWFLPIGGHVIGFPRAVDLWRRKLECKTEERTTLPITVNDGTSVIESNYLGCNAGARVTAYEINKMGHTWPPRPRGLSIIVGETSNNFNVNKSFMNFIDKVSLNAKSDFHLGKSGHTAGKNLK